MSNNTEIKNNIINFINNPNFDKNIGLKWYANAKKDINNILLKNRSDLHINEACLLVSILSPANKWHTNLKDFENLISFDSHLKKYFTYRKNVQKAFNYIQFRDILKEKGQSLGGIVGTSFDNWINDNMKTLKTYNFTFNLINSDDNNYFTIDRHMIKICGLTNKIITKKQYLNLQSIFLEVYKEQNFSCGFANFQAVLWCNYVFINKGILHY
jgi:hypothetical protein